ncbi:DUF7144 family membrane protein [Nocardioides mesophilus]|uniref:DUF7144 domain-containing protein n=1 Tax=Nocardioides mesophilus TaxID=433659 RepID=A0A7G9RCH1_9ACTN|nr:hypothetical protein [Nocardioides mesophilus]QNN53296.1 hypothetical protein H9L09_02110 [Nocardioides mesophilus]
MPEGVTSRTTGADEYSGGAVGITVFAGVLMILVGIFHVIQGIVALANDTFFVLGQDYVFKFDVTAWGWVHLIAGVLVALAGFALFRAAVWARTVAVILACVSILASFAWMPYYPLWSFVILAFDIFVIWAVTVHGRDIVER